MVVVRKLAGRPGRLLPRWHPLLNLSLPNSSRPRRIQSSKLTVININTTTETVT